MRLLRASLLSACAAAALAIAVAHAEDSSGVAVLDSHGFWRVHLTMRKPLVGAGADAKETELGFETPTPPDGWQGADFDDGSWRYLPGPPFAPISNWAITAKENVGWGTSPGLAVLCMRGKFLVNDPARVGKLTATIIYRGGAVLYLNGKELARCNLPKGTDMLAQAEPYPPEAFLKADGSLLVADQGEKDAENVRRWRLRTRRLENVEVPSSLLRRGVNVLSIEVHRAAYHPSVPEQIAKLQSHERAVRLWGTCGLVSVRLTAQAADGLVPNVVRPQGLQVWNSDILSPDFTMDWGDPNEKLRPIRILSARNGCFSGKVVVGSPSPLRGLKASVSDLKGPAGTIPASAVRIRYAAPGDSEPYVNSRYVLDPALFLALEEKAPEEVPVRPGDRGITMRPWLVQPQPAPVFGAVQPVWLTVKVPRDAATGVHAGTLTIAVDGAGPIKVPVEVTVYGYRSPEPCEFRTFVDVVNSPESVALKYELPLYGDKHFEMLSKSFQIMGEMGSKVLYIPLICQTNQGNEQSLVRWVKQPGGGWKQDYSVLDRYLDLAAKHLVKPAVVCLYAWDVNLGGGYRNDVKEGEPVKVTAVDSATGAVETVELPKYADPQSPALWKPVFDGVMERLRKRGWDGAAQIGLVPDSDPAAEVVKFFGEVLPGVPWMRHCHGERRDTRGAATGYQSIVWSARFPDTPDFKPMQGWKRPNLITQFCRSRDMFPIVEFRLVGEMNVGGTQRGFGRVGLDFWEVLKDKRGRAAASIQARYPQTAWANLDWMLRAFAQPGPDGPTSTFRVEAVREGVQESDARVFIESALDAGKLSGDLKRRAEELVQERTRMVRVALDNHSVDGFAKDAGHDWWSTPGPLGYNWYIAVWPEYSRKVYELASEVAAATGAIPGSDGKLRASAQGSPSASTAGRREEAPAAKAPPPEAAAPAGEPSGSKEPAGDEEQSKRLYNSAQNFLANGATALARKKLEEVVAKYPNTKHAAQARRQLEEMKLRQ